MSQVMKALKQSEQSYQAQSYKLQPHTSSAYHKKPISSWGILLCLIAPVVFILIYLFFFKTTQLPQQEPAGISKQVTKPVVKKVLNQASLAKFLTYPDFSNLKPLPAVKVKPKPVVTKTKRSISQSNSNSRTTQGFDEVDLSGVSPELAKRFKEALQAYPEKQTTAAKAASHSSGSIVLEDHLDEFAGDLPKMNFQNHIYVSDPKKRWVKVNDKDVYVGDWIVSNSVRLEKMTPTTLTVSYKGQYILIPALYDWNG